MDIEPQIHLRELTDYAKEIDKVGRFLKRTFAPSWEQELQEVTVKGHKYYYLALARGRDSGEKIQLVIDTKTSRIAGLQFLDIRANGVGMRATNQISTNPQGRGLSSLLMQQAALILQRHANGINRTISHIVTNAQAATHDAIRQTLQPDREGMSALHERANRWASMNRKYGARATGKDREYQRKFVPERRRGRPEKNQATIPQETLQWITQVVARETQALKEDIARLGKTRKR